MTSKLVAIVLVIAAVATTACGRGSVGSPIQPSNELRLVTTTLPSGTLGAAYSAQLSAIGGSEPYSFSADNLPAGLTVSPAGQVTGMITVPGQLSFNTNVRDSAGKSASAMVTIPVAYEPLPKTIRLKDVNTGGDTHMWASLNGEPVPARGSKIVLGPGACPSGCFQNLQLSWGLDPLPNPFTPAYFDVGFSQDCQTISHKLFSDLIYGTGGTHQSDPKIIWGQFTEVPKCLVIRSSFPGDMTGPAESGSAAFLLDYQHQ